MSDERNVIILVADDDRFSSQILAGSLNRVPGRRVVFAVNGQEAIEVAQRERPDIILLDITMPVLSGLDACRRLREIPEFVDTPILFQTGVIDDVVHESCFTAGANDVIIKPVSHRDLNARVKLHLDRSNLVRDLKLYQRRIQHDLNTARSMQMSLIPSARIVGDLERRYGVRVHFMFRPSSEIGGDLWSITPIDDTRFAMMIADFSGHGITAAINTFRLQMLLSRMPLHEKPHEWLEQVNKEVCHFLPRGQYATAFAGIFDVATGKVEFAGAAHPNPLTVSADGSTCYPHNSEGFPLGVDKNATYDLREMTVGDGVLFLYSDGLTEAERGERKELIGEQSIRERIMRAKNEGLSNPIEAVVGGVIADGFVIGDDLTAIWIEKSIRSEK